MNIKIKPDLARELNENLIKSGKSAVRIVLSDFTCSGPIFDLEFSQADADDFVLEQDGIKFIMENKYAQGVKIIDIVKVGDKITVKRPRNTCGC